MRIDAKACYRALETRDARFDGRFFTAVKSTGVFCRPICPAPTPKLVNCTFYASAAAALEAGYRPCLRCLPETSPGAPAWNGTSAIVTRALKLIEEGGLDDDAVENFASRLGVGGRHLRRLFDQHLGASPQAVAQAQRLLLAKKLVAETTMPLGDIAFASGFSSVRRFNEAFRTAYGRPPRELRGRKRGEIGREIGGEIVLRLGYRPPYDWDSLIAFLAPRAIPGVEQVTPESYRRAFRIDGVAGVAEVRCLAAHRALEARLRLEHPRILQSAVARLRRVFDLTADPGKIAAHLEQDPRLRPLVKARPGLRVPGAWSPFEMAVRAVLGQQVTAKGATTLAGRVAERCGVAVEAGTLSRALSGALSGALSALRAFPEPAELMSVDGIGLTKARARALEALVAAARAGEIPLDSGADPAAFAAALEQLPGLGPWTAQYAAMRGLGDPDAFPAGDLVLRNAFGGSKKDLIAAAEKWRPWRAYAAMHLWTAAAKEK